MDQEPIEDNIHQNDIVKKDSFVIKQSKNNQPPVVVMKEVIADANDSENNQGADGIIVSIEKHSEKSNNKMAAHKNVVYRIKKKRKINNNNSDKIQKVRRPQFDPRPRTTTSTTEKIEYSTFTESSTKFFVPTPMPLHQSHMDDLQVEETTFKSFKNFVPTTDHSVLEDNFYVKNPSFK